MMYRNNVISKLPQNIWLISISDGWSLQLWSLQQAVADAADF